MAKMTSIGGQALIEGIMMRGPETVSYTHLDVYKRQADWLSRPGAVPHARALSRACLLYTSRCV